MGKIKVEQITTKGGNSSDGGNSVDISGYQDPESRHQLNQKFKMMILFNMVIDEVSKHNNDRVLNIVRKTLWTDTFHMMETEDCVDFLWGMGRILHNDITDEQIVILKEKGIII